jgi:threonine/homoserine/homoserine lactone efflux protein
VVLALISQTFIIVLLLTFSFGPAFFALINTGIKYGYRTGSLLAVGVVASDMLLCVLSIFLVHYGATNYIHDEKTQRFMGIVAGVILIIFGSLYFRKPVSSTDVTIDVKVPSAPFMLLKGFFLNSLNPAVWLLWLANVTTISKSFNFSIRKMFVYFGIMLALVLLVELGKVSAANRLKKLLTPRIMHNINVVTGVLLVIFGMGLIYNHYFDHS